MVSRPNNPHTAISAEIVPEPAGDPDAAASAFAWPTHLKTICTVCMVLGILGLLAVPIGASRTATAYFGTTPTLGTTGDEVTELTVEMQTELLAVERNFIEIHIATLTAHLPVAILLTLGGYHAGER